MQELETDEYGEGVRKNSKRIAAQTEEESTEQDKIFRKLDKVVKIGESVCET